MINVEINNKKVSVKEGSTILDAVKEAGVHVPTLCHMKDLTPTGACRLCVVEVEGMKGLIPSCSQPATDGMKIKTHSKQAVTARKTIIELLLSNHPDDCLYCVRASNCDLKKLSIEYGVRDRNYSGEKRRHTPDLSSPAIVRDPEKCILCGKCVRVCEEVQGVSALDFIGRGSNTNVGCAFDDGLNVSSCINCGQCILVCPTGALSEKSNITEVIRALNNPDKIVVVQHAPSISVTIAEEFGVKPGVDACGMMTGAFRTLGFDYVFDTSFSADLTIMEEASELVQRIKNKGKLPMFTSCSPGWIKYVEQKYPEMIENLSTCKSPQQMLGAVIKGYFAPKNNIDPKKIVSVAVMPCTAKKFEAQKPEMMNDQGMPDVDYVLTTRELAALIKQYGLDLNNIDPQTADMPFGTRSTSGKLFGASGGVMEAAVRTAHFMITGKDLDNIKLTQVRGNKGIKETRIQIGELEIGVAVVSGLGNATKILDEIKNGRNDIHFIEFMTCPGGCINGGGQPIGKDDSAIRARAQALYSIDAIENLRFSHRNPAINDLYKEFLEAPLSEKSHHLLHTHYHKRETN